MPHRPSLLFISPRFLLPADSGGKIRTGDILRGMKKSDRFHITLAQPAPPDGARWRGELSEMADKVITWPEPEGLGRKLRRYTALLGPEPVSVATDRSPEGRKAIRDALGQAPDLTVIDFPHAAAVLPEGAGSQLPGRSILFSHNVEAEIYRRTAERAENPLMRGIWAGEATKMAALESQLAQAVDCVIAVSDRDAEAFREIAPETRVAAIPTGVDLHRFPRRAGPPSHPKRLIFCGSMDWHPNIDAVDWMIAEMLGKLKAEEPELDLLVVGKKPPDSLIAHCQREGVPVTFTGFVDSVIPHVHSGAAYVIPLRIGGGTRIKVYEAMAMGVPVIATALGVEGLPLLPDTHYRNADTAEGFVAETLGLLRDPEAAAALADRAYGLVKSRFSAAAVAEAFERICLETMG